MDNQSKGNYLFFVGYLLFALGVYFMAQDVSSLNFYANMAIGGLLLVAFLYFEQGRQKKIYSFLTQAIVYSIYLGTYALFLFKSSQTAIANAIIAI